MPAAHIYEIKHLPSVSCRCPGTQWCLGEKKSQTRPINNVCLPQNLSGHQRGGDYYLIAFYYYQIPFKWSDHITSASCNIAKYYSDSIMGAMASQITSLTIVRSNVYSGADQRKHRNPVSLTFVREIQRGSVKFPHKWPVTRKMFPFHDVIMNWRTKIFEKSDTMVQPSLRR